MAYRQLLIPRWLDINGQTCTQSFHTVANPAPSLGSAAAVIAAMQTLTHSGLVYTQLAPVETVDDTPGSGAYPSVTDRAQIILRSDIGTVGRINVPAPVDSMFLAGSERVDFSNADVMALLSAVFAALGDPNGNPWTAAVSGKRMKIRNPSVLGG